jgi:hypothetical protein
MSSLQAFCGRRRISDIWPARYFSIVIKKGECSINLINKKPKPLIMKFYFTLFLSCFLFIQTQQAQTSLNAGDASLLWIDLTTPDDFGFVTFVDITVSTRIYFNENGANNGGLFDTGEGVIEFIVNTFIPAGTIIQYNDATFGTWSTIAGTFALSSSGDQLFIFQDGDGVGGSIPQNNPVFIHAVNASSRDKNDGCDFTDSQQTDSPSTLTPVTFGDGPGTFMALGTGTGCQDENDFLHFTGGSDFASIAAAKAAIQDPDNWLGGGSSNTSANSTYTTAVAALLADGDGITQSCTDAAPPTITCPATQNRNLDGNCNYQVEDFTGLATTTDDCGPVTVTQSPTAGQTFNGAGTTPITLTATDGANNTASCNFNLVLIDNTNPVVTCPVIDFSATVTVQIIRTGGTPGDVSFTITDAGNNVVASEATTSDFGPSSFAYNLPCDANYTFNYTDNSGGTTIDAQVQVNNTPVIDLDPPIVSGNYPFTINPCNEANPGTCSVVLNGLAPTVSDNCNVTTTYTLSGATMGSGNTDASGQSFNVGTTTLMYTSTDASGNAGSCSVDITIDDNTDPVANCPSNITQNQTAGQCGANVNFTIPAATDNCSVMSTSANPASGSFFAAGTTQVTVTAMDASGNTGTCTFDVTINDTENPTANCPGTQTVGNDAGQCGANVNFSIPDPSDNCPGATSSASPASGSFFNVGTTTVTVTATDASGNTNQCMFDVVVNDTENPLAACPANITTSNTSGQCGANVPFSPTIGDNCPGVTAVASPASGSFFSVGTTEVTVTATDAAGNQSQCTFDVTVNDTEAPMANCPADITVSNDAGSCGATVNFSIPNPTDNCIATSVANPASGDFFPVGTTAVTVTATDGAGNTGTCSFNVTVNDTEAPVFTLCPEDIEVNSDPGQCGAIVNYNVAYSENCAFGTNVFEQTEGLGIGALFPVGTTTNTFTLADAAGNMATPCTFNVIVNDNENPMTNCPADIVANNDPGQCGANVNFSFNNPTDNCPGTTQAATDGPGFYPVGTTTITVTATDAAGNQDQCTFDVTVNDTEAPNMVCNSFNLNLTGSSTSITASQMDGGSTDNCGIVSLQANPATFNCSTLGAQTVTLTGFDAAGNQSSCTGTVTVVDSNAPTAVCANPTVNLTSDGTTSVAASFFDGGSSAVCGSLTFSASQTDFDCDDVGNTIAVTLTVTAQSNNQMATCTAMVTVEDPQSFCCAMPEAVCNNFTVMLDANGMGSITPQDVGSGSTAECGLMSETVSQTDFDCDDIGSDNMVTYTITDVNNDSDDCTATITVEDNILPTPVCKTTTVELSPDNGMYTLQEEDVYDDAASADNCSIEQVSFPATTYDCDDEDQTFTIPVTVTDAGGNTASCNAMITVVVGNDLPSGWDANNVGNSGTLGNEYSFDPCTPTDGEFAITGGGNNATSSTTDNVAFASQSLCGNNVSITAKIESVDPNGYGGLMIRETTAAGSKQVSIFSNQTFVLRHETRYTTNGPKQVNAFYKPAPIWLRLERQGNWIFAYYSSTGMPGSFQYVHGVFVPMSTCVEVGLASFTYFPGQQTTTVFSNVSTSGGAMPTVETPEFPGEEATARLQQSVSLFPNPASSTVNLEFEDGLRKDATVILRNQLGQVIEQRALQAGDYRTEWNVSHLTDGLYLFEIRQEGEEVQVLRLVKTR